MKVRLVLELDDKARYVIAQYFKAVEQVDRARATRSQCKRFAAAAVRSAVREHSEAMTGRVKATIKRLGEASTKEEEQLVEPKEKQRSLVW